MTTITYTIHKQAGKPEDKIILSSNPKLIEAIEDQLKYYNLSGLYSSELPRFIPQLGITITKVEDEAD